jgi:hypothetical protein
MSIDEYNKKMTYSEEAKAYTFEIYKKSGKILRKEEFSEVFPIFLKREEN